MFSLRIFGKKKVQPAPAENVALDSKSGAAAKAPVTGKPPEAGKQRKIPLLSKLFGRCQRSDSTSNESKDSAKSKTGTWFRLFKRHNTVAPAPFTQEELKEPQISKVFETPQKIEEKEFHQVETREEPSEPVQAWPDTADPLPDVLRDKLIDEQLIIEQLIQEDLKKKYETVQFTESVSESSLSKDRYGFPNIWQTCYMNSSLQSLLTLEDFVRDISHQEEVWSSVHKAELIKWFMAIRDAHSSTDAEKKNRLLCSFKEAVSIKNPEFSDNGQKDAHEFLTSVLNQIRLLSPMLRRQAARFGRQYRCPVKKHLLFKMETIRTCKSCRNQSRKTEDFTNLSVDLLPGGSVEEMIDNYQRESDLEFKCECGGNISRVRTEFETLPRVLILHLKRFTYSPSVQLMKLQDPVEVLRDLVVPAKQEASCFSLVSIISHYGSMKEGHYISDSVDPDDDPNQPTDHWLTFNDKEVTPTTGRSVCHNRKESAYVLFYVRRE